MKVRFGLCAVMALGLVACSDPHDKVLPQDPSAIDQSTKDAVAKLSEDEKKLLFAYELRHATAGAFDKSAGVPPGTTIRNALDEQRQWEADQAKKQAEAEALRAQVQKAHDAAVAKLSGSLDAILLGVSFLPSDFPDRPEDKLIIKIVFTDKSSKPISGIKGTAFFRNMFGDLILQSGLTTDETIQPGKPYTWVGSITYNQFEKSNVALKNADPAKLKFDFEPEAVVFADGTTLNAPPVDSQ